MATDPVERVLRRAERPIDPRPEFAEALLTRLLAQLEPQTGSATTNAKEKTMTTAIELPGAVPRPVVRPARARAERPAGQARRSWLLTQVATAALLLLTLSSALISFSGPRNWGWIGRQSPGVENELIARADVAMMPNFLLQFTGITRFTLAPGQLLTSGPESTYGDGVYLFLVEAGTVSLMADGPAELMAGGNDTATPMASGAEAILTAGDRGVLWPGTAATWRNDGPQPAVVLNAAVGEAVGDYDLEEESLVRSMSIGWPEHPVSFAFHRLTFEPGASLPVAELPGLWVLGVDRGSLEIPLETGPDTPIRIRDFDASDGLVAGDWEIAPGEALHNSGPEPAVVYILLVESTGPPATPGT